MKKRQRYSKAELRAQRKVKKAKTKALREKLKALGQYHLLPSIPQHNGISSCQSTQEEQQERVATTVGCLEQIKKYLPVLLKRLKRIPDPRNVKKVKHSLTLLITYGILMFVAQMSSRREANREMTRPQILENLKLFFPELTKLPHQDTLYRLLEQIEVEEIASAHVDLLEHLMRKKKFRRYLLQKAYVLAVDGTQKLTSRQLWDTNWQARILDGEVIQHYVYVVEASLVFRNGMVLPLMSEFLTPEEVAIIEFQSEEVVKRDCEQMAARRLLTRIKERFPRLNLLVSLDGLYANGPMMAFLRAKHWDYMIVLKDDCLKEVWEDYKGLQKIEKAHIFVRTWKNRRQCYHWSNEIEYEYRTERGRHCQKVHVVVCDESWEEIDQAGHQVTRTARFAWLSEQSLTPDNVSERSIWGGRSRWGIETENMVEKCCGYHYEHAYSYFAQAMKGYHYFLRLGLLLNTLIRYSADLVRQVKELGHQGLIKYMLGTLSGPWFSGFEAFVRERMAKPKRLVWV